MAHSESPPAAETAAENTSGHVPERAGLHLNVSSLLLCSVIAAAATTVALVVVVALDARPPGGPPPGPPPAGGAGRPMPPPLSLAPLVVTTALFVVSWLAVLLAVCRDRIIQRVGAAQAAMRLEIASLRRQVVEYGEARETDGYLYGMRSVEQPRPARLHALPQSDQRPSD